MTTKTLRLRNVLLIWIVLWGVLSANAQQQKKPNILVIFGDDIGWFNVSDYNLGMMGYRTPNIDRIAREGMLFTDYYGQQSCTAGRAAPRKSERKQHVGGERSKSLFDTHFLQPRLGPVYESTTRPSGFPGSYSRLPFWRATPMMRRFSSVPPLLPNECASSKCTGIASPTLTGAASWLILVEPSPEIT